MKKLTLCFVLAVFFVLAGISTSYAAAEPDSDLAIGDPLTEGWRRSARKKPAAVKQETSAPSEPAKEAAPAPEAKPAAPEEKPAEPAK